VPLYEFHCPNCGNMIERLFSFDKRPEKIECDTPRCEGEAEYHVAMPGMIRVKFDQNGRIGYKHDMGDGKKTYRSATREQYEHTIGNKPLKDVQGSGGDKAKSVYTKEYDRHVRKQEKEKVERRKHALKEGK
jgi:putative FmdB family regulatory protein